MHENDDNDDDLEITIHRRFRRKREAKIMKTINKNNNMSANAINTTAINYYDVRKAFKFLLQISIFYVSMLF